MKTIGKAFQHYDYLRPQQTYALNPNIQLGEQGREPRTER